MRTLGAPWAVQWEAVEGCTRLCSFCGLASIRTGPGDFKRMPLSLARKLVQDCAALCPRARYEFAMHGEPMAHPALPLMISHLRTQLPDAQVQVTTNGRFLLGAMAARLDQLYSAGVHFVVLDTYEPERGHLLQQAYALRNVGITVVDFYRDWHPAGLSPWTHYHGQVQRTLILMDDLALRTGEVKSRTIYNSAGNNRTSPPAAGLQRTCTLPFRELTICWNGDVNACCEDWAHEYVCGNATTRSLSDIWYGPEFMALRAMLGMKRRAVSPCYACNKPSGPRAGLLPHIPLTPAHLETLSRVANANTATNHRPPVFLPEELRHGL